MKFRSVQKLALGGALLLAATGAAAGHGDEGGEERFAESQYRHDVMEIAKDGLTNFLQHIQGKADHAGHVAKFAQIMALSASMAKDSFAKDTRGMAGKTDAKDAIWENWADYAERMDKYAADTAAFAEAAKTEDMAQIMPAFKQAAGNCKSCHDKYRD